MIYLNLLAAVYYWSTKDVKSSGNATTKFSKLYNKLLKEGIIFPKKFECLRINENFEQDLEAFIYEDPNDKSPAIAEIG